jgi:hypothetical protein
MVIEDFVMLGKTVPEPYVDGRIFVCSAGVSPELSTLMRIYPLARRHAPERWTVNRVQLERNPKDSRRESWKLAGNRQVGEHEMINMSFHRIGEVKERDRAQLLSKYVVPSIAVANERRMSLAVIHPLALPRLRFDFNPGSPNAPRLALFEDELISRERTDRFAFSPRLEFSDTDGAHSLMLRDWGCFEFLRKHGDDRRYELFDALHLTPRSSLLVGNMNHHRNAWLVISVVQGLRDEKPVQTDFLGEVEV